jgi:hypothetical protein
MQYVKGLQTLLFSGRIHKIKVLQVGKKLAKILNGLFFTFYFQNGRNYSVFIQNYLQKQDISSLKGRYKTFDGRFAAHCSQFGYVCNM